MNRHLTPLGRAVALIILIIGMGLLIGWGNLPIPPLPSLSRTGFVPGVVVGVGAAVAAGILLAVVAWVALRRAVLRALGSRSF